MPQRALFGLGPCPRRRQYCGLDPLRRVTCAQKHALAAKLRRTATPMEGDAHDGPDQRAYDAARAEVLEAAGFRVVRVRNGDVTRAGLEALVRTHGS